MKQIVAVDPGLNACGVALLNEHGYVTNAALVKNEVGSSNPLPERWEGMALAVAAYVATTSKVYADRLLAIEMPKIYPASRQEGDPNDIVRLAGVTATICALSLAVNRRLLYPRDWKGTLDGDEFIERWIKPRLFPREHDAIELPTAAGLQHNVYDAIGIGLHVVGRLEPKRVIAR